MQINPRYLVIIFSIASVLFSASSLAAGVDPYPDVIKQFQMASIQFNQKMVSVGATLLFALAGLQITLSAIRLLIKGEFELASVVGILTNSLIGTAFFYTVIVKSPTWFPYIIDQWQGIGATGAATDRLDPGAIMSIGIYLVESMRNAVAAKASGGIVDVFRSVAISIQVTLVYLLVLFAFFVLAGQMAMAMIKAYLWLCIAPVLIGFAGLSYTKDVAINTMKSAISIGVTILTIYVIAGIAITSVPIWNNLIEQFTIDNWIPFWWIVVTAGLLALSAWQVPKIANDFINGSVSGGVSEVASAGIVAAAGLAAVGAGAVAAGGTAVGTAKSGAASVAGLIKAGAAGMQSAADSGKTGLSALAHAAGEVSAHSSSILGGRANELMSSTSSSVSDAVDKSFGGQVAQSIEGSRGGSVSSTADQSSTPSHATSTTSASANASFASTNTSGGSSSTTNVASSNSSKLPSGMLGDGSSAALNPLLDSSLSNNTLSPSSQPLHNKIRDLLGYVPAGGDETVAVNASIGERES